MTDEADYEVYGLDTAPGRYAIPLQRDEFERAWVAKDQLIRALRIEERFAILVKNYLELEEAILKIALRTTVTEDLSYDTRMDYLREITRHFFNFLSTARLYHDQVDYDLSLMFGEASPQVAAFRAARSSERENHLAYRSMEAIRNKAQHVMLPGDVLHISWRRLSGPPASVGEQTIEVGLAIDQLRAAKVPQDIIEELAALTDGPRIMPLVREYLSGIARVHDTARTQVEGSAGQWEDEMMAPARRLLAAHPAARHVGILARVGEHANKKCDLFQEPIRRRERLRDLHHAVSRVASHIVTNRSLAR